MTHPLEEPMTVYRPFDADEIKRLRTYVHNVESLASLSFFTDPGRGLRAQGQNPPASVTLVSIDDEAVVAAAIRFRLLYEEKEYASYRRTLSLLKAHVAESPIRSAALAELRKFKRLANDALNRSSLMITEHGKPLARKEIVKLFLYGRYLHQDPLHSSRIDGFILTEAMRGEFLGIMYSLTHVYWTLHNVVQAILETPVLLPGSTTPVSGRQDQ